jgi:hypothetical protein
MSTTTVTKNARTVVASATKTAATVTRGRTDLQTALGGLLTMKITNGATAPTAQCVCNVLVSHNATMPAAASAGADWKTVWSFGGGTTNAAITEQSWEFGPGVMSLEVEFAAHTGNDITVEAYLSEVTNSVTT